MIHCASTCRRQLMMFRYEIEYLKVLSTALSMRLCLEKRENISPFQLKDELHRSEYERMFTVHCPNSKFRELKFNISTEIGQAKQSHRIGYINRSNKINFEMAGVEYIFAYSFHVRCDCASAVSTFHCRNGTRFNSILLENCTIPR